MKEHYGHMDNAVVDWLRQKDNTDRIISFDLETKVIDGRFLNNERILAISIARLSGDEIETEIFTLKKEDDASEFDILQQFDDLLHEIRPLIVVGFNHRSYDAPLLAIKMRRSNKHSLWSIKDLLERAYLLDIMHAARFEIAKQDGTPPKILSLAKLLNHSRFSNLPLMRTKYLVSSGTDKGQDIYNLWKNNPKKFASYAIGDAYDSLLIFKELFLTHRATVS